MDIDSPHRIAFLKKIHLFHGLDDDQVRAVAEVLEEESCKADADIIKEGERGERFYLIYCGNVCITQQNKQKNLGLRVEGDYFGEEALLNRKSRVATVTAQEETVVLSLTRDKFGSLLKQDPKLKINFEATFASQRLARQKHFSWLEPEEVIYFLARKHQILLWQALTGPVMSLIIPVALMVFVSIGGATIPGFVAKVALMIAWIIFLIIVGVIIWDWIDWGNDYYIVTNQRVIWVEKIIGIYDSRQEAPLSTVLSVGVQTDQLGRWLDYGDVIIRTFVGKIIFHHVYHPNQAGALVEEHWGRAKTSSRKTDMENMGQTIRQKLGLPTSQTILPEKVDKLITQSPYKPSALALAFSNIFKLRYEVGSTITYRKHWIVLVENIWQPTLIFITGLVVVIWRAIVLLHSTISEAIDKPIISLIGILLVPIFFWWLYQYIDWRNDIFQVTEDQILDIDKTPLGKEERKVAPLDNILTTESQRAGFLQVLWNYGDVLITIGGAQMVFEDVRDPASVQQDIDRRRLARIERKKELELAAERERVADWFVSYHRSMQEMSGEQDAQNTSKEQDVESTGEDQDDKVQ